MAASHGGVSGRSSREVRGVVLAQTLEQRAERRLGHERQAPGDHLEQHDAERVEVRARVDRLAERLLGREVFERAENRLVGGGAGLVAVEVERQAEVGELHLVVRGQQEIPRLDVAMQDAEGVQGRESFERLRRPLHGVRDRQRACRRIQRQAIAERAAVDDLHGQEDRLAGLFDVEDPHDARMDDIAGDRGLAAQAQERPLREPVVAQDLERDFAPQGAIEGAVDHGVAAGAENLAHFEALRELGTAGEKLDAGRRPFAAGAEALGAWVLAHCVVRVAGSAGAPVEGRRSLAGNRAIAPGRQGGPWRRRL